MRTIQLDETDVALVFRGDEPGKIELNSASEDSEILLNRVLAQALLKRCSEDPAFVDEQVQWLLWGEASNLDAEIPL